VARSEATRYRAQYNFYVDGDIGIAILPRQSSEIPCERTDDVSRRARRVGGARANRAPADILPLRLRHKVTERQRTLVGFPLFIFLSSSPRNHRFGRLLTMENLGTNKENGDQEGITVAIRMRPLNKNEGEKQRVWKVLPTYNSITQTTNTGKPLSERVTGRTFFAFDKVFDEDINTIQVYDGVAKGIVASVVNGLNGTIFAYGQTSSGKTYTMQGSGTIQDGASAGGGIVHMAARDIFSNIQSQPNRMFLVRASFLEIYNEEVRDLLSNSSSTLQIREDPRRGVFVQSQEEMVTDFSSLLRLLFQGEKSRQVASTGMNERSSRSHTIFRITVESRENEESDDGVDNEYTGSSNDGAVRISTLNLVDLAGSESVRHTGATGDRQKEGGMINQRYGLLS
jgi:centromeric protein E